MPSKLTHEGIKWPFLVALATNDSKILGMQVDYSAIWEFDTEEKAMRYVDRGPNANSSIVHGYHSSVRYNDAFIYIPYHDKQLAIFDTKKMEWKRVPLNLNKNLEAKEDVRNKEISGQLPGHFYGGCVYRNQLFLFPFGYGGLIKYNIHTNCVEHCVDFRKTILKNDVALFHNYVWMDKTTIILSCFYSNHVVLLDLEKNNFEIKAVGREDYRFSSIVKYDKDYWLIVKNKLVFIKWNPYTGSEEEFIDFPWGCDTANDKHCFDDCGIYQYDRFLYCFPASCNMALKVDLTDGGIYEIKSLTKYCQDKKLNKRFSIFNGGARAKNRIYLQYQLGKILEFDLETENVHAYDRIAADSDSIKKWNKDHMNMFLESISPEDKEDGRRKEKSMGKRIYDTVSGFRNR